MPFDWADFLRLADELAASADEASKRTAISRAYYFVFNIAYARAVTNSGGFPGGESYHHWCWNKYRGTPNRACQQLGNSGQRMKAKRVKADYKNADIPRLADEVARVIADARQFEVDLAALDPAFPHP